MALTVRPYTDHHGIKSVIFALEFAAPISIEALLGIRDGDSGAALKKRLPRLQEQRSIVLNLGAPHPQVGFGLGIDAANQPISGLQYDCTLPDGRVEWAVAIQQTSILITCGSYARWKGTSDTAREFLRLIVPHLNGAVVAVVGLQYVDEFQSTVRKEEFQLSGLFSQTSRFVPQNLVERRGPCHSHHGYFDLLEEPPARILNNVNVNVLEEPSAFRVEVVGSHRCMLREPIALADAAVLEPDGPIGGVWEKLHAHNKAIIGDILIDEVKRAINFDVVAESQEKNAP